MFAFLSYSNSADLGHLEAGLTCSGALLDVRLPLTRGGGLDAELEFFKKRRGNPCKIFYKEFNSSNIKCTQALTYLLHHTFFLDLALTEFLEQHQLSLLKTQLLLQLLYKPLALFSTALLNSQIK